MNVLRFIMLCAMVITFASAHATLRKRANFRGLGSMFGSGSKMGSFFSRFRKPRQPPTNGPLTMGQSAVQPLTNKKGWSTRKKALVGSVVAGGGVAALAHASKSSNQPSQPADLNAMAVPADQGFSLPQAAAPGQFRSAPGQFDSGFGNQDGSNSIAYEDQMIQAPNQFPSNGGVMQAPSQFDGASLPQAQGRFAAAPRQMSNIPVNPSSNRYYQNQEQVDGDTFYDSDEGPADFNILR
jgi:hypothetical protein